MRSWRSRSTENSWHKIAEILETAGTRFAAPTRLTYLSSYKGLAAEKAQGIVQRVAEPRASDSFRFNGDVPTGEGIIG